MMVIKDCPKCGGEHWGSYKCPFTEAEIQFMKGETSVPNYTGSPTEALNKAVDARIAGQGASMGYAPTLRQRLESQLEQVKERAANIEAAIEQLDNNAGAESLLNALARAGV